MKRTEPRTPKGFKDSLPEEASLHLQLRQRLVDVYQSYGFVPIDTPTIECTDTLFADEGQGIKQQIYRLLNKDNDVVGAVRYDLTVPLARYVAQHLKDGSLTVPFKRFHIGKVMRGENTQKGRFREFYQCDFDVVGTSSEISDIETAQVFDGALSAVGIKEFTININHRQILEAMLRKVGAMDSKDAVLRVVDKLHKIGQERTQEALVSTAGLSKEQAADLLGMLLESGSNDQILDRLAAVIAGDPQGQAAVERLRRMCDALPRLGVPESRFRIAPDLARGLAYYTGVVYEVFLDALPSLGAVAAGGRYDNLANQFTDRDLPGVGGCVGIDRLITGMKELGLAGQAKKQPDVLVAVVGEENSLMVRALEVATTLRAAGMPVNIYPGPAKLATQLKYADKTGSIVVVVVGLADRIGERLTIKDLRTSVQTEIDGANLAEQVGNIMGAERFRVTLNR